MEYMKFNFSLGSAYLFWTKQIVPEMFENKAEFAVNSRLLARASTKLSGISGARCEFMNKSALPLRLCRNFIGILWSYNVLPAIAGDFLWVAD